MSRLFGTPRTVAYQAPPSMGFSRQQYWNGLPFPSPGDLLDPGIEPGSPALQADALLSESPGKPPSHTNKVLGKTEGKRRRRRQRMKLLDGIISSMDMSLSKLQGTVKDREACHAAGHGIAKGQTLPGD